MYIGCQSVEKIREYHRTLNNIIVLFYKNK